MLTANWIKDNFLFKLNEIKVILNWKLWPPNGQWDSFVKGY